LSDILFLSGEKSVRPKVLGAKPKQEGKKEGLGGNSVRPTNFGRNLFEFFRTHTTSWEMSGIIK